MKQSYACVCIAQKTIKIRTWNVAVTCASFMAGVSCVWNVDEQMRIIGAQQDYSADFNWLVDINYCTSLSSRKTTALRSFRRNGSRYSLKMSLAVRSYWIYDTDDDQ